MNCASDSMTKFQRSVLSWFVLSVMVVSTLVLIGFLKAAPASAAAPSTAIVLR